MAGIDASQKRSAQASEAAALSLEAAPGTEPRLSGREDEEKGTYTPTY